MKVKKYIAVIGMTIIAALVLSNIAYNIIYEPAKLAYSYYGYLGIILVMAAWVVITYLLYGLCAFISWAFDIIANKEEENSL